MDYATAAQQSLARRAAVPAQRVDGTASTYAEALLADQVWPGSVSLSAANLPESRPGGAYANPKTWFDTRGLKVGLIRFDDAALRTPAIPATSMGPFIDAQQPPPWILRPWSASEIPLQPSYRAALNAMSDLWNNRIAPLGIVPADVMSAVQRALSIGYLVWPSRKSPVWADARKNAAWNQIVDRFYNINLAESRAEMDRLRQEAQQIEADSGFWTIVGNSLQEVASNVVSTVTNYADKTLDVGKYAAVAVGVVGVLALVLFMRRK